MDEATKTVKTEWNMAQYIPSLFFDISLLGLLIYYCIFFCNL